MFIVLVKRYKSMILASIFFFYIGCGLTLSFLRLECAEAVSTVSSVNNKKSILHSNSEYIVLILSGPSNEEKRDAIRATWSKLSTNLFIENGEKLYKWNLTGSSPTVHHEFIKYYFAIGTLGLSKIKLDGLIQENSRSHDLLFLNELEDSYKKLSLKILLALSWISSNVEGLKYLIKCDDDSFVRIDLIVRDLEAFAPQMSDTVISEYVSYKENLPSYKGLYWGYFDGRAKVFMNGKWQERDWFLCDHYLPYALGGGYVISQSIVDYISRNADFLSHYISEDVSMGVWTAALKGVNRVHDIRFDTQWRSRGCVDHMLVRHNQTPSDMFLMYKSLVHSHGEKLCSSETPQHMLYRYKWNVLPSMCCKQYT
ncbi:beta-1,3-galactosyltransferase 6 [Achroia grisella]|uniref:beta-1,3-galactosyltransferase 6 n=1 Tax=Achroia grisella TaxID=688607 RepID=UPI0027D258B6|nr:beta-1,3-galactosyltransferase 6 [Achroia grisella]